MLPLLSEQVCKDPCSCSHHTQWGPPLSLPWLLPFNFQPGLQSTMGLSRALLLSGLDWLNTSLCSDPGDLA